MLHKIPKKEYPFFHLKNLIHVSLISQEISIPNSTKLSTAYVALFLTMGELNFPQKKFGFQQHKNYSRNMEFTPPKH